MKKEIHPPYQETTINCVCGASWKTKSTAKLTKVDICASCHPFYSGKQKIMDSEGRIEKFRKKYARTATPNK
ncbi:MAG: 50S ribosomal protein L31 [Oligoflexia bacterium]|nr:50S ribosomal protein L31 [Oligoflexia bacterium]MBF0366067.1 50S ribosomal protein L31 [Oligoflexia bacterium]